MKRAHENMSDNNCYRSRDSARLPTITIIPEDLVIECISHSPDFYATLLIFYSETVF